MKATLAISCLFIAACGSNPVVPEPAPTVEWTSGPVELPDVPVSQPPFDVVHANWKQRLGEAYIYLDHRGDYREAGPRIAELLGEAAAQGAPLRGAPFILYYDDPSDTPIASLRARIAIGLSDEVTEQRFTPRPPLFLDQLPERPVVYAAVGGSYAEVARAYPGIIAYMQEKGWSPSTPIRESYLIRPAGVPVDELVTEVQIPWGS